MDSLTSVPPFAAADADPGGTLKRFQEYIAQMELVFDLAFRKSDGTAFTPSDAEKKSMTLLKGGKDMRTLFEHVGEVVTEDTFAAAVRKIEDKLKGRTNKTVQRNMLLCNNPQGSTSFEKWSQRLAEAAKLIDYDGYNWKAAVVDAVLLQTSNKKLRERALQEEITYEELIKLGIAKEQSQKGAKQLEQAAGFSCQSGASNDPIDVHEKVRRLQLENSKLKKKKRKSRESKSQSDKPCTRCAEISCNGGTKCKAHGQKCSNCKKMNHFAKACRTKKDSKKQNVRKLQSDDSSSEADTDSDSEVSSRIVVGNLGKKTKLTAKVKAQGEELKLLTDTGIRVTLLNLPDWRSIRNQSKLVKTSRGFRPYGTKCSLPIIGKAFVTLKAENGASIQTWVYILRDEKEQSLLGEEDGVRLGIVTINLKGAHEEVMRISSKRIQSDSNTPPAVDAQKIIKDFPKLFSNKTGRCTVGGPIPIQMKEPGKLQSKVPRYRRVPLHFAEKFDKEIDRMLKEDIIEGPIEVEEPGTHISNVVLTEKKGTEQVRVTLDCADVNEVVYQTHEPIPTIDELRHEFKGSNCFTKLDMTNCYHQFEIAEEARKLYTFRTPKGLFRFKRMVPGTSPASSEIQKRVREMVKDCPNTQSIKDDIIIHTKRDDHEKALRKTLTTLQAHGITLRPKKCELGKTSVKWFGYVFCEDGMSPDPEKCSIIQQWPSPKSTKEVKSFLQTVQFNAKFMAAEVEEEDTFPELTAPLRRLTLKNAKFVWGREEEEAFCKLKDRLCSSKVLAPYDTKLKTRLYVDSSPVGTQATVAQQHSVDGESVWRPVNHTSRPWTSVESRYAQIERESNGILTGMCMNKMYTLGTNVEVVTDHKPLIPIYNANGRPRQLRVDRHRTKLLPYEYSVTFEPGKESPCDYGSRHPPSVELNKDLIEEWGVELDTDILVNRIISDSLEAAITLEEIRSATEQDAALSALSNDIGKEQCADIPILQPFKSIFHELSFINGIIVRNNKLVIPESLQQRMIEWAHEGHQYTTKTLQLLRETCWFPKMHTLVAEYVETCIPCHASSHHNPPVPLEPNRLPKGPWQDLHADFKGPIGGKYYVHIVIDQFSKYPEVDIVKSTSFKQLRPVLDRIFATHGVPEKMTTDNGPPYFSDNLQTYAKHMGFALTPVTPEDPQSNGFVENFVKSICKVVHTASAEGKNPKEELSSFLLQYRATPHATTERTPAELLFGRKIKTKLPRLPSLEKDTPEVAKTREIHDEKKRKQKQHFDKKHKARPKHIKPGDRVLLKQKKTTTDPPYNPKPYTITKVHGNQLTMDNGTHTRVRDKNNVKIVQERKGRFSHVSAIQQLGDPQESDADIEIDLQKQKRQENQNQMNIIDAVPPASSNMNINPQETHAEEPQEAATSDQTNGTESVETEEEISIRMQQLLDAAIARESTRREEQKKQDEGRAVTRSRGLKLAWNPTLSPNNPLMKEANH